MRPFFIRLRLCIIGVSEMNVPNSFRYRFAAQHCNGTGCAATFIILQNADAANCTARARDAHRGAHRLFEPDIRGQSERQSRR